MNKNIPTNTQLKSPCVRNCCLDNNEMCLGCFRTINEIIGWQSKSENIRQQILNKCEERQQQAINSSTN